MSADTILVRDHCGYEHTGTSTIDNYYCEFLAGYENTRQHHNKQQAALLDGR